MKLEDGKVTGLKAAMETLLQQKIAELSALASVISVMSKELSDIPDDISFPDAVDLAFPDHRGTIQ